MGRFGLDRLRKHNKFGNHDVMVFVYCQNKTADNWFHEEYTCSENQVPSQASYAYDKMSEFGCRNEPRVFLLKDDGSIKELGK